VIALVAFAVGAAVSASLWAAMSRQLVAAAPLRRQNYRGHELPVAAGIVIVLTEILVGAAHLAWVRAGGISADEATRGATILAVGAVGFGLIGLFDDLAGPDLAGPDLAGTVATKGFRGHLRALAHGELTTGMVKLVWGVLIGFIVSPGSIAGSVRGGLIIAAAANVANLFDRAPGRVIKVSLLGAAVVALLGAPGWHLTGPMLVVGAGLGLLIPDLRERCMLGDTGANVLGAAVGFGVVIAAGPTGELIALAVLVALNALSEVLSFSRVIDRVPPLRMLDRLGSLPERRTR
jgi:hypothetical protein